MVSERASFDLAGFALSHALWSIADGEPLCTLAIVEALPGKQYLRIDGATASICLPVTRYAGGMRTLLRFEAETIQESIDIAHSLLAASAEDIARSALVWDAFVTYEAQRLDAAVLEVASHGLVTFTLAQRYLPRTPQAHFSTIGRPLLLEREGIAPLTGEPLVWLLGGMEQHRKATKHENVPTIGAVHAV